MKGLLAAHNQTKGSQLSQAVRLFWEITEGPEGNWCLTVELLPQRWCNGLNQGCRRPALTLTGLSSLQAGACLTWVPTRWHEMSLCPAVLICVTCVKLVGFLMFRSKSRGRHLQPSQPVRRNLSVSFRFLLCFSRLDKAIFTEHCTFVVLHSLACCQMIQFS